MSGFNLSSYTATQDTLTIDDLDGSPSFTASAGDWIKSGLIRGINNEHLFSSKLNAWAKYTPQAGKLQSGWYKISVYRIVYTGNTEALQYTMHKVSNGQDNIVQTKNVDMITGSDGWIELGTYYLSGDGSEYMKVTKTSSNGSARIDAIRFEPSEPPEDVEEPPVNIYIAPDDFNTLGTWQTDSRQGAFRDFNLLGLKSEGTTVPATATVNIPETSRYYIWARSFDVSPSSNSRLFQIGLGGNMLPFVYGKHGAGAWKWELGDAVDLTAGNINLELVDISCFWARVDGIFITNDPLQIPPSSYEEMRSLIPKGYKYCDQLKYPDYAASSADAVAQYSIGNEKVRYTFYEVETPNGTVIQHSSQVNSSAGWIDTGSRTDKNAWLLLFAEASHRWGSISQFPLWSQTYTADGAQTSVITADIYKAGAPYWMVPSSIRQIDEKNVELTAQSEVATLKALWSISDDSDEPLVTLHLTSKKNGSYSIGIFAGNEQKMEDVSFFLAPYRIAGKCLPDHPYLVTEAYASAPVSMMTVDKSDKKITYAVAADPSGLGFDWPRDLASRFALSIRGKDGGVQPAVFAPVFGSEQAVINAGSSYEFKYRPVIRVEDWFNTYDHVVHDIVGLTDYRSNYLASLNDAIDNTRKLMMDDKYAGWDPFAKSFYNIEGKNVTSMSSPLALIQSYLLTEDKKILEKRTIPTLENLLSRGSFHFSGAGAESFNVNIGVVSRIGNPIKEYGTSVFGGAYNMTRGMTPALRAVGIDSGVRYKGVVQEFSEYLWMYKFTGNTEYLNEAKTIADRYIAGYVDKPVSVVPNDAGFVALSYYPDFGALIDLYDATKEQKYLNAAVKAARIMLTTVFTGPVAAGSDYTVDADAVRDFHYMKGATSPWWKGDEEIRLGYPDKLKSLKNETIPDWVVSRAGLSVEATQTFRQHDNSNMIMTLWAPDLLRLAQYSGEKIFEEYARNAVIGRYSTYPGYYYTQYMAYQMDPHYPYKGPDITGIYYHHIPAFLGMLEDFIITQAWKWSNGAIDFPYVRQQGYAFFESRHYGFESGSFFDMDKMWLWLKKGLVTSSSKQIDYVAARKDGVFAVALMNESDKDETCTVGISAEATGDSLYTGNGILYTAQGEKQNIQISNGNIDVTVPAHGLIALRIDASGIKAPDFAAVQAEQLESALSENSAGSVYDSTDKVHGSTIQMTPDEYYAYVYVESTPAEASKVTLHYRVGDGMWKTQENTTYPFEFTIKVKDIDKQFSWYFDKYDLNGNMSKTKEYSIKSLLQK